MSFHLIGIGGIGMSGLAELLLDSNAVVSGSDLKSNERIEKLTQKGARIFLGHDKRAIHKGMTVIYNSDIKPDNPEWCHARELQCPLWHRSELLENLMQGKRPLLVTGTHGKTSTSSLLAYTLVTAGVDPSFALGGVLKGYSNAKKGKSSYFVAEADESDGSFLRYPYFGAIVTNIDSDHMNYFKTKENQIKAFEDFFSHSADSSLLFKCGDDPALEGMPGTSYGFSSSCDWKILQLQQKEWCNLLTIAGDGKCFSGIELNLIGRHNALNACAVFGLMLRLGISEDAIREGFKTFPGVVRRADKKGEYLDILFIDDYAHHPKEIKTTLEGIKKAVGLRRVVALFEPHRFTRTKLCLEEFTDCFAFADEVLITDIDPAGEEPIPGISKEILQEKVRFAKLVDKEKILSFMQTFLRPQDVCVTLGAGGITHVGSALRTCLKSSIG